jgi:hypothetical protein
MAPPWTGQRVRLVEVAMPPPSRWIRVSNVQFHAASCITRRMELIFDLQGYNHCMPYGHILPSAVSFKYPTARPFDSTTVPFVCRLSPLHPGYVITLCECAREMKSERSAIARLDNDDRDSILIVSVCMMDQRPANVSLSHTDPGCSWLQVWVT